MVRNFKLLVLISLYISSPVMAQDLFFLKAKAFEQRNLNDSALFYYNMYIEKKPQDVKGYMGRGTLYNKCDSFQNAWDDYIKAEKIKKNIASFELACLSAQIKDTIKTLFYLESHLSSSFKLPASQIRLEPKFAFLEKTDAWKKLWQKSWYNKIEEQTGEADFLAKSGDWMALINFINDLSHQGNLPSDLLFLRAKAYNGMDNPTMALYDLNKLLENSKRNPLYFEFRADLLMLQKSYKSADQDLTKAIDLKNDQFNLYKKRAVCRMQLMQSELALQDIRLFLELFPADKEGLLLSVKIHSANSLHLQALSEINQLISRDTLNSAFYLLRAEIYNNAGMEHQAGRDFNYCISISPNNQDALLARGKYFMRMKDLKSACIDFRKAEKAGNIEAGRMVFENCGR